MRTRLGWFFAASVLLVAGCADSQGLPTGDKPEADPDVELLSAEKADRISNRYTAHQGELTLGVAIEASIDWPDYFHGYTVELRAGQTIEGRVTASEHGPVRFYGPAHRVVDGEPRFRRALVADTTGADGAVWTAGFTAEIEEDGVYMVVYGPSWWWYADYQVELSCVDGCANEGACSDDDECAADEFCGDNGVRCIMAPCDANFDVCQPRLDLDAHCDRDRVCAAGLSCVDGTCRVGDTTGEACRGWDDDSCEGSFCGCTDHDCSIYACKAYSAEGEGCGGFVPAHMARRCEPELACVGPRFIADLPGSCGTATTVAEILADPKAYDGRFVGLGGHVDTSWAICTEMACSPENACCNRCGAEQRIYDAKPQQPSEARSIGLVDAEGQRWGCSGNECDYGQNCTVEDAYYWVGGWVKIGPYGDVSVEVARHFQGWEMP